MGSDPLRNRKAFHTHARARARVQAWLNLCSILLNDRSRVTTSGASLRSIGHGEEPQPSPPSSLHFHALSVPTQGLFSSWDGFFFGSGGGKKRSSASDDGNHHHIVDEDDGRSSASRVGGPGLPLDEAGHLLSRPAPHLATFTESAHAPPLDNLSTSSNKVQKVDGPGDRGPVSVSGATTRKARGRVLRMRRSAAVLVGEGGGVRKTGNVRDEAKA